MKIEEATQTKDGTPVRIYATDGGGDYPVHGAIWTYTFAQWVAHQWSLSGVFIGHYGNHDSDLDLDLHDWRDDIPWSCLRDEIQWVAKDWNEWWFGYDKQPYFATNIWMKHSLGLARWSLNAVKMPKGPADWREAIAKRPEGV